MTGMKVATTRRDLLIGGIGVLCAGASVAVAQNTDVDPLPARALEDALPQMLGKWSAMPAAAVVMPPEGSLTDRLYSNVMVRAYQDGQNEVTLLLAYGALQSGGMQMHRPELCYPAAGFAIDSSRRVDLPLDNGRTIAAKLLDTRSSVRKEQVLYWTRIGREFPTSRIDQRWTVLRENFAGRIPDGMLVRTSVVAQDANRALPILNSFVSAMTQDVAAPARKLLFG